MTPKPVQTFIFFHFRSNPNRSQKRLVFTRVLPMKTRVWLGAESNRRHVDFQSTALPTELPSRHRRRPCDVSWGSHYATIPFQGKAVKHLWRSMHFAVVSPIHCAGQRVALTIGR